MVDHLKPEVKIVQLVFNISHELVERRDVYWRLGLVGEDFSQSRQSVQLHSLIGTMWIVEVGEVMRIGVIRLVLLVGHVEISMLLTNTKMLNTNQQNNENLHEQQRYGMVWKPSNQSEWCC